MNTVNIMRFAIGASALLLSCLIWLGIAAFLRLQKKKSVPYMTFFTIFYVYIFKVLDYTLFQFQSLLLLKHFMPKLMLRGQDASQSVNFLPLITLTPEDVKTSLLNMLLMVPFGYGLPFISSLRMKQVVLVGALFSIGIEMLQWATGFIGHMTFRVADINDVVFNTAGTAIGYFLFSGFMRLYRRIYSGKTLTNPLLRYIAERPQVERTA